MKKTLLSGVVGVLLFALHAPVQAAVVDVSVYGTVVSVDSHLSSVFSVGDPVTYSFTYETNVLDVNPDPHIGVYPQVFSGVGTFGSYVFVPNALGSPSVYIENNTASGDALDVFSLASGPSVSGWPLWLAYLVTNDPTGGALSNDTLPNAMNLNLFPSRQLYLGFFCGYGSPDCYYYVNAQISQTPLPAAFPLFATGLGLMGLLGWRRKRKGAAIAA